MRTVGELEKMKTHPKNILRVTAFLLGFALLLSESRAQLITSETFSGLAGTGLIGSDSSGWSDSGWKGGSDTRFSVINPTTPLSYQIAGGALLNGGNEALQLTTSPLPDPSGLMAYRSFTNQNATIYMSWLMQVTSSGSANDLLSVDLLNGTNALYSVEFQPSGTPSPTGLLLAKTSSLGGLAGTLSGNFSTTYFVVAEFTPNGTGNNTFNVWFDPSYNSYNSSNVRIQESGLGAGQLNGIGFSISSTALGGPTTSALFDSLKIGYTWGDVVPLAVPEPSSYALLGLGLLALVIAYMRRISHPS